MTQALICHAKGCTIPAPWLCDACKRSCCSTHSQRIALQRRQEVTELPDRRELLARVPTETVTFTLCPRCAKRPFDGARGAPAHA